MSLFDTIRAQILSATKAKDEVCKNILKVVLGEIHTMESRTGIKLKDEEIHKVIKKTVEGIDETLKYVKEGENYNKLVAEKQILSNLLPQYLSKEAVLAVLNEIVIDLKAAKSDGQATGVAMKLIKEKKLSVDGKVVSEAVKEIRTT
jgi:uncharacterized protein YqeY